MGAIDQFYRTLVCQGHSLDVGIQREITTYAATHDRSSLLAALVTREDIDPALEQEISRRSDLDVIAAWAASPRRTPEQLRERLIAEKRVGALLPLAELTDLPAEVYRTIGKVRSVKLGEALITNPSAPMDLRIAKICEYVSHKRKMTWSSPGHLRELCGDEPLLVRAAAEVVRHPSLATVLVESGHLEASHRKELIARLPELLAVERDGYNAPVDAAKLLTALSHQPIDADDRHQLLAAIEQAPPARRSYGTASNGLTKLRQRLDTTIVGLDSTLGEMAEATSPAKVGRHYRDVLTHVTDHDDRRRVAEAVARHPHMPIGPVLEQVGMMNRAALSALFSRLLSEGDVASLAELAFETNYSAGLENSPHLRAFLEAVVARCSERSVPVPRWVKNAGLAAKFPDLAMGLIPWRDLLESLAAETASPLSLLVQERLLAGLGDDRKLWESFESLGADYEGSLDELLSTVKLLA